MPFSRTVGGHALRLQSIDSGPILEEQLPPYHRHVRYHKGGPAVVHSALEVARLAASAAAAAAAGPPLQSRRSREDALKRTEAP